MKKSNKIIFAALVALFSATASGQRFSLKAGDPLKALPKMSAKERAQNEEAFRASYPLLAERMIPNTRFSTQGLKSVNPVIPYRSVEAAAGSRTAGSNPTFWTSCLFKPGWTTYDNEQGLYSFTPVAPYSLDAIKVDSPFGNWGGSSLKDGVFYLNSVDLSWINYGYIFASLHAYDITDWHEISTVNTANKLNLFAIQEATASDGTVYGEFYDSYLSSLEYGIVDYSTQTRTTIGPASKVMVAMGVTSDNELFGVCKDGDLYKISTTDGTETLIGSTHTPEITGYNGYYIQCGEIDQKDNTFYWAARFYDGTSGLYTVDLGEGHATKIGDFADGTVMLADMFIPDGKMAKAGAPAAATNLSATFVDASTSGTVNFTAPSRDYANSNALTGSLTYYVTCAYDTLATGNCAPGASVSAAINAAPEGMDKFIVTTSNSAGVSPPSDISLYVGYDIPAAPDSVYTTWKSSNTFISIRWTPVTTVLHNAFLGPITYNVVRIEGKDTTVIAESTSATTVSDSLPANVPMDIVKYAVRAVNGNKSGAWKNSAGHVVGSAFDVPYYEDFEIQGYEQLFTIIDANKDGITWGRYKYFGKNHLMRCKTNKDLEMDDWLITPPIKFKPGHEYHLRFYSRGTSEYNEKVEVKFGNEATVAGMTTTVLPPTTLLTDTTIEASFTTTSGGIGYVGFHGCSDKDMYELYIDSIDITAGILPSSPAEPTITVTPGARGALTASVNVVAPTKTADGGDLTADHISTIAVKRDGTLVHTFENVTPGQSLAFEDAVPADGRYTWTAIPYDDDEAGKKAEVTTFIGLDVPQAPQNAQAIDEDTKVKFRWDAVSEHGANGEYVDPTTVKTYLYETDDDGYLMSTPADSVTGGTSLDLTFNTNDGKPDLKVWGLANGNRAGKSKAVSVALPVGAPYHLPFVESVANGKLANSWWLYRVGGSGNTNWWYTNDDAVDADGGSLVYAATVDSVENYLNSHKISLAGAVDPKLIFSYDVKNSTETTRGKLAVEIQKPDGSSVRVFTSDEFTADKPWKRETVDLSQFASERWILVQFHTSCTTQPVTVGLDQVRIQDTYDEDLSAELTAPASVLKGQKINAVVKVSNDGFTTASAYSVKIFADDTELQTIDIADSLSTFKETSFSVAIPTSSVVDKDKTEKVIKAQVVLDGDLNPYNDAATATVGLLSSIKPAPENLTGSTEPATVELNWDAPVEKPEAFSEDFEGYDPFGVDEDGYSVLSFGDWTTIDGNPTALLGGFLSSHLYPGQYKPGSFVVFNADAIVEGAFKSNECLQGHNASKQFAGMPYESDATGSNYVDGDNYLVSPELSGEAQTVSFFAKNAKIGSTDYPEKFAVLTSTTGNAKADFTATALADTTVTGGEWQEFNVAVPQGTKYFAVHQNSSASIGNGNFLLSLDDFTFHRGSGKPVSYNIYCDGVLVGTISANGELTYTGDAPFGSHLWYVTAVYSDGQESEPVSVNVTTGIDSIVTDGEPFDVFTIDGKLVRQQVKSLNGLKSGVYIINEHKVIVR